MDIRKKMLSALFKPKTADVGHSAADFQQLLDRSHKQAYNLALRLTGNHTEAQDLVQETYIRAYRFFHRYDTSLPFTNWLYRIMSNAHIDCVRRRSRLKTTSLDQTVAGAPPIDIPDTQATPDKTMLEQMMGEHVQAALMTMTPDFRTAVLLADVEGMAYEEIADVMNTSVGTVRSRIHRGRKQLRSSLIKNCPEMFRGYSNDL
jgi:RNA polymerase sigma-70 factor (ECF subfamily)